MLDTKVTDKYKQIRHKLLMWAKTNKRTFYWRTTTDPYIVLISEILLKRTTAPAVENFIPSFLNKFPDAKSLSRASLADLHAILQPLGLARQRAQQLKDLSDTIMTNFNGKIPKEKSLLLELPGIGDYSAGAIVSFAFCQPEPIVDTNIARLIMRVTDVIPSHYEARRSPEIWEQARALIGHRGKIAREINWAMLDICAAICRSKNPLCSRCTLKLTCSYYLSIKK